MESSNPDHNHLAQTLLAKALHKISTANTTSNSNLETGVDQNVGKMVDDGTVTSCLRLGIAGPPGAGKSTFIEALGLYLINQFGGSKPLFLAVLLLGQFVYGLSIHLFVYNA